MNTTFPVSACDNLSQSRLRRFGNFPLETNSRDVAVVWRLSPGRPGCLIETPSRGPYLERRRKWTARPCSHFIIVVSSLSCLSVSTPYGHKELWGRRKPTGRCPSYCVTFPVCSKPRSTCSARHSYIGLLSVFQSSVFLCPPVATNILAQSLDSGITPPPPPRLPLSPPKLIFSLVQSYLLALGLSRRAVSSCPRDSL